MTTSTAFPPNFRWGAAAASYQIEGAVEEDGRGPSIWDVFSHTPGKTANGDTGDVAVDHYRRYREDVGLMADLGIDSYRFSISWSRLMADGVGDINRPGVQFYRDLCEELLENGIEPVATLYHWDLPQALFERGGWLDVRSADWFAQYAAVAKEHLGDLITVWATLNEPWCSSFLGYSAGEHAPGITDPGSAYVAAHNLMLAHHRGLAALRATKPRAEDELGIVLNTIPCLPASESPEDAASAALIDAIQNRQFADAVFFGTYPEEIRQLHERFHVADVIDLAQLEEVRQDLDWLGINYYNINRVAHVDGAPAPAAWAGADEAVLQTPPGELTAMGWGVEPEGLELMLRRLHAEYPAVPIVVSENGAAFPDEVSDDGTVHDPARTAYIRDHLGAIAAAIADGVNVTGYFVWSLLDNFEWAKGYDKRFGVIRVDYDTLERTIKDSGHWYRDFIATQRPS